MIHRWDRRRNREFARTVVARLDFPRTVRDHLCNNAQELEAWCTSYAIDGLLLPDRWFRLLAEGDASAIAAYLLSSGGSLLVAETDPQAKFMAKVDRELKHCIGSTDRK